MSSLEQGGAEQPNIRVRPGIEISPVDVKQKLDAGDDMVLIDCRRPDEHAYCHIDGAKLFTLERLPELLDDLQEFADRPVVIYCHHGVRSMQMAGVLKQQGFSDVLSMAGGIDLWSRIVDPQVPRY